MQVSLWQLNFQCTPAIFLTVIYLLWMLYWARTYRRIRRGRAYARDRALSATNRRYKWIGYSVFFSHNSIALAAFWVDSGWLLKIPEPLLIKLLGSALLFSASWLHAVALGHLKENYSPCFDSHLPKRLVTSGPYRYIRHPDYATKLIIALAGFMMTGSLWMLALLLWLAVEMARTIGQEERALAAGLNGYTTYQARTSRLLPFVF